MPKIYRFPLLLLCLASLAAGARADTIALTSGERIEGRITAETATELTVQIQVSAGITDERVIKKADILKVDRIAADETAYRAIMNLQPGRNSSQPAQYDALLNALRAFTTQYPANPHAAEVQAALNAFQAEKKRVEAGEVKFDGLWLSRPEAVKQRVQIGGSQAFQTMKNANASGDAIGALNAYAFLEKNFPGAKVLPDAIQLAQQILAALKPAAERALGNQKINKAERERGFADASPADRVELKAADQREQAKADATLAAATAAGQWPPLLANSEKCIAAVLARSATEAKRLETLPVASMRESIRLTQEAQTEFTGKNLDAAAEMLREALTLWPANDLAIRLQAQITAAKTPPKSDPASIPAATPPATAATATPAVKHHAATPAPVTIPAPAPQPPPATTATPEPAPPEQAPKPFFMTLGGAITIVVVLALLLAGANIFNHIRQRSEDPQE